MKNLMIAFGNFIFRWRDTIFSFIFLAAVLVMIFTKWGHNIALRYDIVISIVGIVIAWSGQFVRIITIGYAYIKRGGLNKQIYAESIVRRGLFAHTRNPMYVGNLLIATGALITTALPYFLPVLLLFYFIYACIILAEEKFLGSKFGDDYQAYLREVPRLIPGHFGKWKQSIADMTFTWKRVLKKEHGSFVVLNTVLTVLVMLKLTFRHGYTWDSWPLYIVYGVLGFLLIFQMVCATLKRTGKLEWDPNRP